MTIGRYTKWDRRYGTHLTLDSIITKAQVLEVGSCVGLHRGEVVLQHVDYLCQLGVTPRKFSGSTGGVKRYQHDNRHREGAASEEKLKTQEITFTSGSTVQDSLLWSHSYYSF